MAQPRPLKRPPIVEALVDVRAVVPGDFEMFDALADELTDQFPTKEQRRDLEATIEIRDGKLVQQRVDPSAFGGIRIANADRTAYAQFRPDGFTLNNVKVYMGGDVLIDRALALWDLVVKHATPDVVSRVALRYINRLELPLKRGDEFKLYLTSPPELPEGAPQLVSQFLSRVVGHDAQRQATAVVVQQLKEQQGDQAVSITLDVDVFRSGSFPVDSTALREILGSLRLLKNETFFSLLTDEAVGLYE